MIYKIVALVSVIAMNIICTIGWTIVVPSTSDIITGVDVIVIISTVCSIFFTFGVALAMFEDEQ